MKTTNILEAYQHLYLALDNIKNETIDYNRGFQDAIYTLHLALKNFEYINLHIENHKLRRSLFLKELALDDKYEDRHILKTELQKVKQQIGEFKKLVKPIILDGEVIDFTLCQIEFNGHIISCYINCTHEIFNGHLEQANHYIADKYYKKANNKRKVNNDMIKCWLMEFYRAKGFKCSAK